MLSIKTSRPEGIVYVRFGSKADICAATSHVRFTPNSDRKSGFPQRTMSALPPKADMCGATSDVRFGPIADMICANRKTAARGGLSKMRSGDQVASTAFIGSSLLHAFPHETDAFDCIKILCVSFLPALFSLVESHLDLLDYTEILSYWSVARSPHGRL
jgi:hypothetical protein